MINSCCAAELLPFQSLREIDYIIKDKLLFERVLNMEFTDTSETGYFYSGEQK